MAVNIAVHTGRLAPLSVGTVSRVQEGTDTLQQIELIQLSQNPPSLSNPADALTFNGVQSGVSGTLSLNTVGIYQAFVASQATTLQFTFEVQLQYAGGDPITVFRAPVTVVRNVINLNTIVSATMLGLQTMYSNLLSGEGFTYTSSIADLRGTPTSLETVATAGLTLGYRYDLARNGDVETWTLKAGAADPDDLTGQVAPLDYHAGTNNKHWEKGS